MTCGQIRFAPVAASDLPLIARWLAEPHVQAWWGDPVHEIELIRGDIGGSATMGYVFHVVGDAPAGYIQAWDPRSYDRHVFADSPDGARAIDLFVGEPRFLGRGVGAAALRAFSDLLFERGCTLALIDPDVRNTRAVGAYRRAGFTPYREVEDGGDWVLLMRREPPTG